MLINNLPDYIDVLPPYDPSETRFQGLILSRVDTMELICNKDDDVQFKFEIVDETNAVNTICV